jgi:hypothetical protein
MVQLRPGEPGSEVTMRDNGGFDLCIAQAGLVVIGLEESARAASRHLFSCDQGA